MVNKWLEGVYVIREPKTTRRERNQRRPAKFEIAGVLKEGCGDLASVIALDGR